MNTVDLPPLALIAGPTASGKSKLAIETAKLGPVTIINADATQVYADLRILSARPDDLDMMAAPHRLFGYIDAAEACSAARWAADAKHEIGLAHAGGRLPIVVGGTGLYIRALLDGIAPVPDIDVAIREEVRALSVEDAHRALLIEDPVASLKLAPNDTNRIARALEVIRSTQCSIEIWRQARDGGIGDLVELRPIVLLPPRDWLFQRCEARFSGMLLTGAIDEVDRLMRRSLDPALPAMRAIGVAEIMAWLRDEISNTAMTVAGRLATRQYAKRQYTWFRNQLPPEWPIEEQPLTPTLAQFHATRVFGQEFAGLR